MGLQFDGPNKLIIATAGTLTISVRDLWSRWVDWGAAADNSKYLSAMESVGGNDIDLVAGTKIPLYAFLKNGWRLRPQESTHTLNITDGILLVSGGGDPFVNTLGLYIVRINYQQPVQAISFAVGDGGGATGLTTEEHNKLMSLPILTEIEASTVIAKQGSVIEALGLMQSNYYLDQTEYTELNGAKLMTSGRIRTYSVAGSVGTANDVLATYTITSVWDGDKLTTYRVVKQ